MEDEIVGLEIDEISSFEQMQSDKTDERLEDVQGAGSAPIAASFEKAQSEKSAEMEDVQGAGSVTLAAVSEEERSDKTSERQEAVQAYVDEPNEALIPLLDELWKWVTYLYNKRNHAF